MDGRVLGSLAAIALAAGSVPALAQQTTVTSPFHRTSESFSENIGVNWGVNFPGGFFRFGRPQAVPQGGAGFGFGFGGGGVNGRFNLVAGQGSQRGLSSSSPSVTLGNGQTGMFSDTTQVPFVLGLVPVVGGFVQSPQQSPYAVSAPSPIQQRVERLRAEGIPLTAPPRAADDAALPGPLALKPAAAPPAGSVDALRGAREATAQAEQNAAAREVAQFLAKADQAAADGKRGVARVYLQMAGRRAAGEQAADIATRLKELDAR